MSRKSLTLLTAALTLLASSACTKKKPQVWIYTSFYKEVVEAMRAPLQAALPEADVQWFQGGSEIVATKLNAEIAAGRPQADLILTSDPFWYEELKEAGHLLPYESPNAKDTPAEQRDPDGAFVGGRLPVVVIGYNSEAYPDPKSLPQKWTDLTDPKWKGKLTMPSPLESGTAFTAVALLSRTYGWGFFEKLRAQDILVAGGNSAVVNRIETREKPIGICLLENILKAQTKGSPVRAIYPKDGGIPVMSPLAILKASAEPDLAKRAYDWFFTDEGQKLYVQSGLYSMKPSVPAPPGARPFADVQKEFMPWSSTILRELFAKRDEIKRKFSEVVLH